ncbi:LPXTG cell wall anchor domain-containing protein [Paenibacillus nitricinens]|jgi:LPXTG-motif cell wall-anchored protein|uniref:LPXTG cell wall anchor domain-containing protein n=1 Tax=Paenibacillus TaxID=44249 RepID=UPI0015C66DAE|nr:LPXTG cell wall anchor domain-containing protein [Paenibacillus sp. VTT E-133280]
MKKFVIVILTIVALMPMRSMNADWAYSFVVYAGDIYEISDDELIPSNEIDKKIGQVKRYSDHEGTYSGNFSNTYPKGTPYYSIKNIDPKEIIAIKTHEAEFVKAINKGQYANGQLESKTIWISILGSLIIVLLIIWIMKRKKSMV